MALKDIIRLRRTELKMTLDEVGKMIGVSRQTVQKYESGVISNIPSDKIELLANALQTSPAYLMGWEGKKELVAPKGDELSPAMREIVEVIGQLSPENQSKLLELSRLYLDAQRKNEGR